MAQIPNELIDESPHYLLYNNTAICMSLQCSSHIIEMDLDSSLHRFTYSWNA